MLTAYEQGFIKEAQAHGVDPLALLQKAAARDLAAESRANIAAYNKKHKDSTFDASKVKTPGKSTRIGYQGATTNTSSSATNTGEHSIKGTVNGTGNTRVKREYGPRKPIKHRGMRSASTSNFNDF